MMDGMNNGMNNVGAWDMGYGWIMQFVASGLLFG
jgi:hypothetical protein